MNKPILKFNNGRGAILCNECNVIVAEKLTKEEMEIYTRLEIPCVCNECNPEKWREFNCVIYDELAKMLVDSWQPNYPEYTPINPMPWEKL